MEAGRRQEERVMRRDSQTREGGDPDLKENKGEPTGKCTSLCGVALDHREVSQRKPRVGEGRGEWV